MADRTEQETPQFTKALPLGLQIAIGITAIVVIFTALDSVPGGPWNLWGVLIYIGGFVVFWRLVYQSVALRLEDQAVRIRLGRRTVEIPYEQITEVAVGPRTPWWRIGRRRLGDGATGYLMGGPSVRISTAAESVVVSAEESYRVAGAIQRQRQHVMEKPAADPKHTDR
ncbi:hypothetical protein [Kocuria aegyptia]|uniref:DUF304 domain-containing protein n=1 Tax=Kocuria aegyptia TaxID=330943 RepID=A0ABP4W9Q4_9MICC